MQTEKLPDGDRGKNEQNLKERKEQVKHVTIKRVINVLTQCLGLFRTELSNKIDWKGIFSRFCILLHWKLCRRRILDGGMRPCLLGWPHTRKGACLARIWFLYLEGARNLFFVGVNHRGTQSQVIGFSWTEGVRLRSELSSIALDFCRDVSRHFDS